MNIIIEFCVFELIQVPNFALKNQLLIFSPNLPKKRQLFLIRNRKNNINIKFSAFKIVYIPNFSLSRQFRFVWTKFSQQRYFRPKKKKKTSNSVYSKQTRYQFSAYTGTFDFFGPNLLKMKRYFPSKAENVYSTIYFGKFKLVSVSNFIKTLTKFLNIF